MANKGNRGNIEIFLEDVRLSYPHLFEPKPYKNDKTSKPKFSASFILDNKRHKALIEQIEDAIEDAKEALWKDDIPRIKADKICLQDGADFNQEEYQGAMVLRASAPENKPPQVIDRNRSPLTVKSGRPYGGCFVNAVVRIYAFDEYGPQVNCSLEAVQYVREGEAFGGGAPVDVNEKFKDIEDSDEDRPRSRRRSRDEDEDDRPRSRRRDADEEDERPRSRRRDEEDEDDRPRSRRSRDEDEDDRPRRRSRDD